MNVAGEEGSKALAEKIREQEAVIADLREQRAGWAANKELKERLLAISEDEMRRVLAANAVRLRDVPELLEMIGYSEKDRMTHDELRRVLMTLVTRIELDPVTRRYTVHYRLPTGVKVASPRGFEPRLPP